MVWSHTWYATIGMLTCTPCSYPWAGLNVTNTGDRNSSSTLQEPFLKLTNSIKHPNLPQQNSNAVQKKRRNPLIKISRAFAASGS